MPCDSGDACARELERVCHKLAAMGLGTSTSGNVSARQGDRILLTPTGVAMADVAAGALAETGLDGRPLNNRAPTKELPFHLAIYRGRPDVRAVLHVHPTHAIAASAFLDAARHEFLPAVTPQFVMRAGRVPTLRYFPPGDPGLADEVAGHLVHGRALLLQNHGAVTFGVSFVEALGALEELEENCRQWLWVRQGGGRTLSEADVAALLGRRM